MAGVSDPRDLIESTPVGSAQLALLAVCFLLNMVDGFDVLAMSFAAPPLADDWSLPPEQLGLVFSAGVLGMTLGAMFLAPQTDRIGRRPMILAAVAVMGVSMFVTGFARDLSSMIALRVITGLTIGAMLASLTTLVSEFFPDRHRNLAVGVMLAGYPMGAVLGGFLAAILIPEYGWQGVFFAGGIMTLAVLPLIYLFIPESIEWLLSRRRPDSLQRINAVLRRLGHSPVEMLPDQGVAPPPVHVKSLLASTYRSDTLRLWGAFFLCFGTLYFLLSWIPKLLVDAGLPLNQAIYAGIAFNLGGAGGNLLIGWASVKLGLQRTILLFHLIAAAGMVIFSQVSLGITGLLALTAIIGLFQQGGFVGFYMLAARVYPAEIRTTGIGWGIGLGRFGAVAAPYMAGMLIAGGWSGASLFLLYAVPLVIGGSLIMAVHLQPVQASTNSTTSR